MARDSFKVQEGLNVDGVTLTLSGATTGQSLWRNGTSVSPRTETPVGTVIMYSGSIGSSPGYSGLPTGWLLCDGSTFSSETYPALAAVVGNMYGTSSGDNYYLPNLVSKIPVGHTQSSGDTSSWAGAIDSSTSGSETHTHSTSHNSSTTTPNHNHTDGVAASHSHTVGDSKGNHDHGRTDFNAGSHTHTIQRASTIDSGTTGASTDNHNHTAASSNANHAHNLSGSQNSNHSHTTVNSDIASHSHDLAIGTFAVNQSSSSHSHADGISVIGLYFIIRAI
jgi:hypothetical protein